MKDVWDMVYDNIRKGILLEAKYYNKRHKMFHFEIGNLVLLNIANSRLRRESTRLRRKFIEPFGLLIR